MRHLIRLIVLLVLFAAPAFGQNVPVYRPAGNLTSGNFVSTTTGNRITDSGISTTNGLPLSSLAQAAANTVVSNFTGSLGNLTAFAMPSCADSGGSHLNYVSGTGITCGTSTGAAAAGTLTGTTLASNVVTSSLTSVGTLGSVTVSGSAAVGSLTINSTAFSYTAGTWTPVLAGTGTAGTPTYQTHVGSYEQIGRLVVARFNIITTALGGSPTGNMTITGLPFATANTTDDAGRCFVSGMSGVTLTASYTFVGGAISPGTSTITLTQGGSGQTGTAIATTGFAAATTLVGSCEYHT